MTLLIDFTCARRESHSWDSLLRFQKSLKMIGAHDVTICIPQDNSFSDKHSSTVYSFEIKIFEKQLSGVSHKLTLLDFLFSTMKVYKALKRAINKFDPTNLVWPNAEGPSVLAGLVLSCFATNRNFYFRFIAWAEFWTPFRLSLIKFLIYLTKFRKNIFIAFETQPLNNFLGGVMELLSHTQYILPKFHK